MGAADGEGVGAGGAWGAAVGDGAGAVGLGAGCAQDGNAMSNEGESSISAEDTRRIMERTIAKPAPALTEPGSTC
nr:MAG: hypothetical protein DIU78_11770 [Pseudomonadota bacterium]